MAEPILIPARDARPGDVHHGRTVLHVQLTGPTAVVSYADDAPALTCWHLADLEVQRPTPEPSS